MDPANPHDESVRQAMNRVLADLPNLLRSFGDRALRLTGKFDDLLQEVRLAAMNGLPGFKPDGDMEESVRRYVFGIAQHKFIDMQRRAHGFVQSVEDDVLNDAADDGLTPSRIVGKQEGFDALADCMLKLDATDRSILLRKYIDEKSGREVAAEFGLSEDALDNRLRRIRRNLRECWGSTGAYRFVAGGR